MKLLRQLMRDQRGYILSAEAALLGTIGVAGVTVGLGAVSKSLNDELAEVALAFRSLDQSYCIEGETGCRSWTAGSCFEQQDVEESRAELGRWIDEQSEEHERTKPESSQQKQQPKKRQKPQKKRDSKRKKGDSDKQVIIRRRSTLQEEI
jgi:hypothetical protein